ncbi:MAG: hypothetical protein KKH72_04630 [Alphaproteobacteria bacterium]|nr:hypothetical protein [Alphaproteobacteria bacterium]
MSTWVGYMQRIGDDPLSLYQFSDSKTEAMRAAYRTGPKELTVNFGSKMVFSGFCQPGI